MERPLKNAAKNKIKEIVIVNLFLIVTPPNFSEYLNSSEAL